MQKDFFNILSAILFGAIVHWLLNLTRDTGVIITLLFLLKCEMNDQLEK